MLVSMLNAATSAAISNLGSFSIVCTSILKLRRHSGSGKATCPRKVGRITLKGPFESGRPDLRPNPSDYQWSCDAETSGAIPDRVHVL